MHPVPLGRPGGPSQLHCSWHHHHETLQCSLSPCSSAVCILQTHDEERHKTQCNWVAVVVSLHLLVEYLGLTAAGLCDQLVVQKCEDGVADRLQLVLNLVKTHRHRNQKMSQLKISEDAQRRSDTQSETNTPISSQLSPARTQARLSRHGCIFLRFPPSCSTPLHRRRSPCCPWSSPSSLDHATHRLTEKKLH